MFESEVQEPPEVPMDARLVIGDVVHSLAAALDHLVYQLSLSHQISIATPDAVAMCEGHKTHFPIYFTIDPDLLKTMNKRLKLMAQEPADIIRSMQPYKRAELDPTLNAAEDPLWILFKLDVIDTPRGADHE